MARFQKWRTRNKGDESVRTASIAVIYARCLGHTLTPYLEIPPPKVCHPDRQKTSHYRGLIREDSIGASRRRCLLLASLSHLRRARRKGRRAVSGVEVTKNSYNEVASLLHYPCLFLCQFSSRIIPSRKADIRLDLLRRFSSFRIADLRFVCGGAAVATRDVAATAILQSQLKTTQIH